MTPITKTQPVAITIELADGRYLCEIGCLECKREVTAVLHIAAPFRPYYVDLRCCDCGKALVTFDIFSGGRRP